MKNKKIICTLLAILTVIGLLPSIVFAGGEQSGELTYKKVDKPISEEMYQLVLDGVDCGEIVLAANGNGWSIKSGDRYLNNEGDKIVWGRQATTAWTYKKGAFTVDITTTQKTSGRHVLFLYIPGTTTTVTTTYYLTSVANGAKLSPYFVGADLFVPDYKIMLEQAIAAKETAENERDTLLGMLNEKTTQLHDLTDQYNQALIALEQANTALSDAQLQLQQKNVALELAQVQLQQTIAELEQANAAKADAEAALEQALLRIAQLEE